MVHGAGDEDERLIRRAGPVLRLRRMRRCPSPWVLFPVDERQAVIRDVVPSVLVDHVRVRWGGDVERLPADDLFIREVDEAGDERQLGFRHAAAGLQVAPLRTVLVGPAAPGLGKIVLLVIGRVVRSPALVLRLALGCAVGDSEGLVGPAGEVEHRCQEGRGFLAIAAERDEVSSSLRSFGGGGAESTVCCEITAIFGEGGVVDSRVPVAALPAANAVGESVHEVVIVPKR